MNMTKELRRILSNDIPLCVKYIIEKKKISNPNCKTILFMATFFLCTVANTIPPKFFLMIMKFEDLRRVILNGLIETGYY